jgi:hypothetical protein
MADHDDWTADDDAGLRAALTSLRADVEAAPLPDVRFVKARGMARRRQRLLTWTAAAAAAVVVAGTVGYTQFGRDAASPLGPATRSGTTSASPSPTTTAADSLDQPGALPLLQEWTSALRLTGAARLTTQDPKSADYRSFECLVTLPRGEALRQEITLDGGGFQGGQTQFKVSRSLDPQTVAEGIAADVAGCQPAPDFVVTPETAGGWPRLFSYTAGAAGSGWFAVVPGAADVTLIQIADSAHATSTFTHPQVTALADIAEKRLARYGSGAATTPPSPSGGTSSGPKAIDENMPVSGPDPVPSSALFVAASQWTSKQFAAGAPAYAGKAGSSANLGGIGVFCESDGYLSGIGGQVGVVEVRAGAGDANVIGHQRVRVDQSADAGARQAWAEDQVSQEESLLAKGCTESDGTVTVTRGPRAGTFLLTKKVTGDASGTAYRWVGVTTMTTSGAMTTVDFHGTSDGQGFRGTAAQGFAELDRLLALARQK